MKQFIVCLFFCIAGVCFAETIGNIEFHLPSKKWKKQNAIIPQGSESIVFTEDHTGQDLSIEFFLAHKNQHPPGPFDQAALEKAISFGFPGMSIKVNIISKTENDVLLEWAAFQEGKEKIHGLMRIFSQNGGTIILQYLTENNAHTEEAKKIWLPILQEAKALPESPGKVKADG